jgi:dsDNA-binding SOS-regulon protein
MDDFIKILIWVIIIISFFSSIFKKMKKGNQKESQSPHGNRDNLPNISIRTEPQPKKIESKEEIDSYDDMLSEIENLFKKNNESNRSMPGSIPAEESLKAKTSDKTKIESHEAQKKKVPQWHQSTASEHKGTLSEHTLITDWEQEEKSLGKKAAVDFNIESKAKKFEEMMNQKSEPIGIFKHTIKEKLNHPATLKDYILMSEIIGKPKAKRR